MLMAPDHQFAFPVSRSAPDAPSLVDIVRSLGQILNGAQQAEDPSLDSTANLQLRFYESVMMLFEREGAPEGAILFARAALQQLSQGGGPAASSDVDRRATTGRMWTNVFNYSCELGAFEEAYAAILANPVPERALDCLRRLVHVLCDGGGGMRAAKGSAPSRGGSLLTLCSLPFSGTIAVHGSDGAPGATVVPLIQEVILALQRRALNSDLATVPQPYRVLHDFLVSRSDIKGAARAMLAWARRLRGEAPPGAAADAMAAYGEWRACIMGTWQA